MRAVAAVLVAIRPLPPRMVKMATNTPEGVYAQVGKRYLVFLRALEGGKRRK